MARLRGSSSSKDVAMKETINLASKHINSLIAERDRLLDVLEECARYFSKGKKGKWAKRLNELTQSAIQKTPQPTDK